jgi:hypothetical protein
LAAVVGGAVLKMADLSPKWNRIVPIVGVIVLLSYGYQAGELAGLVALLVLTAVAAVLFVSRVGRSPRTATPRAS